jgi:hypothetical protein
MTNNTQTSNMTTVVAFNAFIKAFMERNGDIGYCRYEELMSEWEDPNNQRELEKMIASSSLPKKKKRKSKRKSSGKKRGKSAYIFFCAEERPKIKQDLPDLAPKEVMVELGKRWKEAKKGDTSKWDELAKEDKEKAAQANSSGEEGPATTAKGTKEKGTKEKGTKEKGTKEKGTKTKSSSKGRTRSKSAYIFFCKDMRSKVKANDETLTPQQVTKELGRLWQVAKKGDIRIWEKMAAEDRARVKIETEDKPTPTVEMDPPPPPPAKTKKRVYPFKFWARMHRSEISRSMDLKGKELTKTLREKWKNLSPEKKAEWKAVANDAAEFDG